MANPYHHAVSSTNRFGGLVEDYLEIHEWFDASKEMHGDFRHRALRHHTQGIFECQRTFGTTITTSEGREIPVRLIGEQHVEEDIGFVPTLSDWVSKIEPEPWMNRPQRLSRMLAERVRRS